MRKSKLLTMLVNAEFQGSEVYFDNAKCLECDGEGTTEYSGYTENCEACDGEGEIEASSTELNDDIVMDNVKVYGT